MAVARFASSGIVGALEVAGSAFFAGKTCGSRDTTTLFDFVGNDATAVVAFGCGVEGNVLQGSFFGDGCVRSFNVNCFDGREGSQKLGSRG